MTRQACRHFPNALRAAAAWLALVPLVAGAADPPRPPAEAVPAGPEVTDAGQAPELFVTDRTASRRLKLAEDRIGRGDFDAAVELLQSVLDVEEDVAAPSEGGTFQSVKRRALELIGGLPPDGRRVYELEYGVAARARLDDAIRAGDWPAVEEVSRRYFHSEAGQRATYRLAVRSQDQGEPLQAALLFERLAANRAASGGYEPRLSLRAAAAWQAAGLPDAAGRAVARAVAIGRAPVLAGKAIAPVPGPDKLLGALSGRAAGGERHGEWPVFGGRVDRSAEAGRVTVAGGPVWSHEFTAATEWDDQREAARVERLAETLSALELSPGQSEELTQPAFHPVTVGNVAVFRTLRNLTAVDLSTGRFLWKTERPHDVLLDRATADGTVDDGSESEMLRAEYVSQYAWRNLTTGTLAADGRRVYGVEGAGRVANVASFNGRAGLTFGAVVGGESHNSLFAYDVAREGAVAWTEGGPPDEPGESGRFFLGPPLPLGGRLYCLVEENAEIRLAVLDPDAAAGGQRDVWSQTLVTAEQPLTIDPVRRLSGLSPAFGDGVLVCPTGAGAAVGIDLGGRLLLWGYQYPRNVAFPMAQRPNGLGNVPEPVAPDDETDRWLDAVPRIAEGAVLLTPRDSDELHCLDVADGRLRWKRPRGSMLFVAAVSDGKVVVAGRETVEAFDLKTGAPVWEKAVDISEPAGRGILSGDFYHLPLATGELMTIRISTGEALPKSPFGPQVRLGNLIAVGGRLVSQSTRSVVGFQKFDEYEAELRLALRDGKPEAIALRGEDRLHRGETEAGLADLRAATSAADLPRARRLLAAALLDGLEADFATYRRFSADLDRLADDPAQRADYLRRYGDGLREAGEPAAALGTYLRLLDEGVAGPSHEVVEPGLMVLSDRVVSTRVADLHAAAESGERAAMDRALAARLKALAASPETDRLRRFSLLFRGTPAATDALAALAARYEGVGERLRAEQVRLMLREVSGSGSPAGEESVVLDAAEAGRFDVAYRAEFVPDEPDSSRPPSEVEYGTAVRIIGSRPAEYEGWQFEIDATGRFLKAYDPFGRSRWAVSLKTDEEGPSSLRQPQAKFSGHLMTAVIGMRIHAIDLLGDPIAPRLLWTRDLSDGRSAISLIDRTNFSDQFGRPNGPTGFAGAELLVYQTGLAIVAVDGLSGEPVWQRSRMPGGCEISGDGEFVVLQPIGANRATVLRSIDGVEVAVGRVPAVPSRLGWSGTRVASWRQTPEGLRLECRDVARDREVWSRDFPATTVPRSVATEEVALLDPVAGRFGIIRLGDGETVFESDVIADPAVDRFYVVRAFDRYVLFTHRRERLNRPRLDADGSRFLVNGLAYGFDAGGRRLWSAAIGQQALAQEQPAGLPVLVLTARMLAGGRQAERAAILDLRTGAVLIERSRELPLQPFRTVGRPEEGSLTVTVPEARFLLKPVGGPLPPARADGLDSLAEPRDEAGDASIPVGIR